MRVALNVVAAYAGWFAAALAAAAGEPLWACLASLCVVGLHLVVHGDVRRELALGLAAIAVGSAVDTGFLLAGATVYAAQWPSPAFAPLWIVFLWPAFATLVNVSLAWLKERLLLAGFLGALAAPLSYLAGEKLGAVAIGVPRAASLAVIAAVWFAAFPLILWIARRLDAHRNRAS